MSSADQGAESHGFLGEEFLTWLWFRWENDGGEFTLGGGRVVGVAKHKGRRLIDRHLARTCCRVCNRTCMNLFGIKAEVLFAHWFISHLI